MKTSAFLSSLFVLLAACSSGRLPEVRYYAISDQ
jgi:hypothetical protein